LGAIELLEETGFRLGMPWQHMIVEVSHAQRPPRQRLSSNGHSDGNHREVLYRGIPVAMPTSRGLPAVDERLGDLAVKRDALARQFITDVNSKATTDLPTTTRPEL